MALTRRIIRTLRDLYRRMFRRQEDARTREIVEVLRHVTLFKGFSGSTLRELAEVIHYRDYKRDEFLYYERDPGLGLYIVQRGRVRLLTEAGEDGVHELRQVTEHECFGELSLLGEFRRMETAQALTETKVLGFFSPDLKTMLNRNPSAGAMVVLALARHLATRQVALIQHVTDNQGKDVALRLLDDATQHIKAVREEQAG